MCARRAFDNSAPRSLRPGDVSSRATLDGEPAAVRCVLGHEVRQRDVDAVDGALGGGYLLGARVLPPPRLAKRRYTKSTACSWTRRDVIAR